VAHEIALDSLHGGGTVDLPFRWPDLPRRPCAPGGYRSVCGDSSWETTLMTGRKVRLVELQQYLTYAGVLAGVPDSDEVRAWPIEGALRTVSAVHEVPPWQVAILPPELLVSTVTRKRSGQRIEQSVEFLPPVCCIGRLESKEPANMDSDGSELVAIWFQNRYGPPEEGHVVASLQQVAWEKFASDFHKW
jgi:hypothetical protein